MKFMHEIELEKAVFDIGFGDSLLFLGSCFATNIGGKFAEHHFESTVNPYGVLFNPISVFDALKRIALNEKLTENDFFVQDGLCLSLKLHGCHSYKSPAEAVKTVNELTEKLHMELKKTKAVFLTFGTSEVFRYTATGEISANCHKLPAKDFKKELLHIEDMLEYAKPILLKTRELNPDINIVFTVSPVRYESEGAFGNSLSKGRLFGLINGLLSEKMSYFPAYEIVMDSLRDYRFFAKDLCHPNELAIDYVWEKIIETYLGKNTRKRLGELQGLLKNLGHRPRNPESGLHKKFIADTLKRMEEIKKHT